MQNRSTRPHGLFIMITYGNFSGLSGYLEK